MWQTKRLYRDAIELLVSQTTRAGNDISPAPERTRTTYWLLSSHSNLITDMLCSILSLNLSSRAFLRPASAGTITSRSLLPFFFSFLTCLFLLFFFFFLMIRRPPSSTLFPSTTLFRSVRRYALIAKRLYLFYELNAHAVNAHRDKLIDRHAIVTKVLQLLDEFILHPVNSHRH